MYKTILDFLDFVGSVVRKLLGLSFSILLLLIMFFALKSCFFDQNSITLENKHTITKDSKCHTETIIVKDGKIKKESHDGC